MVKEKELLGTLVRVSAEDGDAVERAFEECGRIEGAFSRFVKGNELAELNSKLGEWVDVSEELYDLLWFAVGLKAKTAGVFDITVKGILDKWGYGEGGGELGEVELKDGRVRLSAEVDLGGLGKGYAVDKMCEHLEAPYYVNAGGDIYAKGGFKFVFENPLNLEEGIGEVEVDGFALASSSAARRKWGDKHHLVDPRRERPADQMLAVYTQADSVMVADAYATALFVLGYEGAKGMVEALPVEAMLIGMDGAIWKSEGFKGELFKG